MLNRPCCSLQPGVNAVKCHALAQSPLFLGRALPRSAVLHPSRRQRSTPYSYNEAGTLQLPGAAEGSQATDIFQSALNALDLVPPSDAYRAEYGDPHEDISVEQGQAAQQVGKAVYEVSQTLMQFVQSLQQLTAHHRCRC